MSNCRATRADCTRIVQAASNKNNPVPLDPDEILAVLEERIPA